MEVGLWEVREWTGVVVDSFVNFLGVNEQVVGRGGEGDEGVRLEVIEDDMEAVTYAGASSAGRTDGCGEGAAREIAGNLVRDAFLMSGSPWN